MSLWDLLKHMLKLKQDKNFIKDLQRARLNDTELGKFTCYISLLIKNENLPKEAQDHELKGEWQGFREFHIGGDKLIIYLIEDNTLKLVRLGTHAQLFKDE